MMEEICLNMSDEPEDNLPMTNDEIYGSRDGLLFVVDATAPMFEINPITDETYFAQCLEIYRNIYCQKLSWNRVDSMGIILFGTKKADTAPRTESILTLQKLEEVCIDNLKKIESILSNVEEYHEEIGSSPTSYPLYDVLWQAARSFISIKQRMPQRRVVLLTRNDNPCAGDLDEQHRLRLRAKDYGGLGLRLSIVGLGADWDDSIFYKDLEMLSRNDATKDYQETIIEELEEQVINGARVTAKLDWRIGGSSNLPVALYNLYCKTKFPQKKRIDKTTNALLRECTVYERHKRYNQEEDGEEDEEDDDVLHKTVFSSHVHKYQTFGGKKIIFTPNEVYKVRNSRTPGIDLIGFKPQSVYDLSHHISSARFIGHDKKRSKGSRALFAALLKRCHAKDVMAICVLTVRQNSSSNLYAMVPSIEYAGFYAYKLTFAENERNLDGHLADFIYNDTNNKCPIGSNTVELCSKIIEKTRMIYVPDFYPNPKLHVLLASIEELAMDRDERKPVRDKTLPRTEEMKVKLGVLKDLFEKELDTSKEGKRAAPQNIFHTYVHKRKIPKLEYPMNELAHMGAVENCTVPQLREYLKSKNVQSTGKKCELCQRVYKLFGGFGS